MKASVETESTNPSDAETKLLVGHFVRRQGTFGTVAVVGWLGAEGVQLIPDPKRLFPRDGQVESHGVAQHTGINPGDWVEFDVAKNQRPRAPEYKVIQIRRMPRYAALPEATMQHYSVLLTREGWSGDSRPGLWAFRISGDKILVAEMELVGKTKRLRVTRASARDLRCYDYQDERVVQLSNGKSSDFVFLMPEGNPQTSFDWSDEADFIARVIRSLADANDPRIPEIITWLDLHYEEGIGKISASSGDTGPALEALRSGALAARLRADRELMKQYLDAALENEAVREAVAAYAREGQGAEWDRLRAELAEEIAAERTELRNALDNEMQIERKAGEARIEQHLAQHEDQRRKEQAARIEKAELEATARVEALDAGVTVRREEIEQQIAEQGRIIDASKSEAVAAEAALQQLRDETDVARGRLDEVRTEIDRLLAIAEKLEPTNRPAVGTVVARGGGISRAFPQNPLVNIAAKGDLISRSILLSDAGKAHLRGLLVMFLAGELPILTGDGVGDLLRVAEATICPGRCVTIEADPTLISLDDLWSRPGSGMPTLFASAAEAAKDHGAVIVVIRGIERSGARFWMPSLVDALRSGGLPRGLFVCCTVNDGEHEEVDFVPDGAPWFEISDVLRPEAFAVAAAILSSARVAQETLDPGPMPTDLSGVTAMALGLEQHRSLELMMRAARLFVEAKCLLGDEQEAARLVLNIVSPLASQSDQ
ncbi:hypothetical protein [Sphingobium sp. 15-1]|uniref:hypothetical protein n=1 Tax=Sphingobium sp. 15-1 TaxID=2729616 RepID=UPI00159C2465|nr:hypothetical protein [Sphingobium sp. 15-1]